MGVRVMRLVAWAAISLLCLSVAAPAAAQEAALREAAFAHKTPTFRSAEVKLKPGAARAVDTVKFNVTGAIRGPGPGGRPITLRADTLETPALDVTLVRTWPQALSVATDNGLEFEVSPHAGVGVSGRGGQAEAGAVLKVSKSRGAAALERLRDMGVADGTTFGDQGRWYFFAAASGRAVGLNMLPSEFGWTRAGWSTDETTDLVGDAQVGVGWKKGDVQSSFGVIHREVKGRHMVFHQDTRDDTVAAFTLTIKPTLP